MEYGGPVGERFAPTLAAEHLASEDGLQVDAETLRRWMLAQLRPGRVGSVIDQVDQATLRTALLQPVVNTAVHLHHLPKVLLALAPSPVPPLPLATPQPFRQQETIWAVADALRAWIERYGVPLALYVDGKNLYKRPATPKERLRGEEPITQFGRMCAKLGIAVIAANSPQAKGRVERIHGTHQDRLVKKLRRKEISSHQHANVYLEREYLAEHNRRFARTPARPADYHRRAPRATELDRIFRLESERTISDDWVVRYDNRFFQLEPPSRHYAPAQGKVLVCEGQHGSIAIEYRGRAAVAADPSADQAACSRRRTPKRAEACSGLDRKTEVGAAGGSPVAGGGPSRGTAQSVQTSGGPAAPVVGLALRFALNAPPLGLRRASPRARPTTQTKAERGKGTLLMREEKGHF